MSSDGQERIKELELQVKKLSRSLEKERTLAARSRANIDSKRLLSEIVLVERSRLERNMRLMLHHSSNMVIFFDSEGVVDFCADLFLSFRGLASFGLIKGKNLRAITQDFLPADFIDELENLLDLTAGQSPDLAYESALLEEPAFAHETTFQAFSNIEHEVRDYSARGVLLINEKDEKSGLLIQIYDTTENMRAWRNAEQANKAKSDFLATVSHEIRTPMSAIIGLVDMLESTILNEQQQEYLGKIRASSLTMLGLINDILDFSKIEADKLDLLNDYFDLKALLKALKAMFDIMMEQKHLEFSADFDAALPDVVLGDEKRIRQVLANILSNAYKYTRAGEVVFSARPTGDDCVRFDIRDTGIGIKEEDLDKLFIEFQQLDVVNNKHASGTGLGLAITKHLTERMEGSLEVNSVYGEGSTFSVILPLKQGTRGDLPTALSETYEFTAPGARVLVVDDVEINIEIVEFMLEPYEVEIVRAYDGLEAVRAAEEQHFDLILMDHMMPNMDGIEAVRYIRELPLPVAKAPIVALTANAVRGVETQFIEAGFDSFVSKPIDMLQLVKTLHDLLPKSLIVE